LKLTDGGEMLSEDIAKRKILIKLTAQPDINGRILRPTTKLMNYKQSKKNIK